MAGSRKENRQVFGRVCDFRRFESMCLQPQTNRILIFVNCIIVTKKSFVDDKMKEEGACTLLRLCALFVRRLKCLNVCVFTMV